MRLAALPGLTLGELLDGDLGLQLVAGGEDARGRRVAGAHSIEIEQPANWLGRDWVMLTTGGRLRHRADAQRRLVADLDELGAAGLGFGVEVAFKRIPPALLDEARTRGLPVFSVPLRTPFRDVISDVNASLLSREVRATQRLSSLQLYLMDALEEEDPRRAVIERLAAFVAATVTLLSTAGRVVDATGPAPTVAIWREIAGRPAALMQFEADGWETIATPLRRDTQHGSWLAVSKRRPQPMAHVARAAVRATAPVLAALARLDDLTRAQDRAIRGAILDALLDGDDADHGSLAARAATLGIDGSAPACVVLLSPQGQLCEAVAAALDRQSLPFLAGTRQDASVLLVQAAPEAIRVAVDEALAEHPDAAAGIGRPVAGIAAVPDSLRDAAIAVERARADPARRLLAYDDFDLATLMATEGLNPKVDELIRPLRAHPALFATVVAYFEHDLEVMRTAAAMELHHNTVRYRLARVEQLLGRPLKDPATIASLYIALHARAQIS